MLQRAPLHLLWGGRDPSRESQIFDSPKPQNENLKEDERDPLPPPPIQSTREIPSGSSDRPTDRPRGLQISGICSARICQ